MKKIYIGLIAAMQCVSVHADDMSKIEISGDVAITSEYVWRGLTQSDGDASGRASPSVSAGLNAAHETGFYAGIWGATVNFNDSTDGEVDFYAGYGTELGDYGVDLSYVAYRYVGAPMGAQLDFDEIILAVSRADVTLTMAYTPAADSNSLEDATYVGIDYSYEFIPDWSLDLHTGVYDVVEETQDFSVGVSHGDWALTWHKLESVDRAPVTLSYSYGF